MNCKAARTSAALSILFLIVYGGSNWLASKRSDVRCFYFSFERHIPFVPAMILPYLSIDLFFVAAPFLCRSDEQLRQLARRIVLAILIAGTFFVLFPLRFHFERPPVAGWLGAMFNGFREMDLPFNQFPSLHIALLLILAPVYIGRFDKKNLNRRDAETQRTDATSLRLRVTAVQNSFRINANVILTVLLLVWFTLIGLSTVLTYQHHVIDLLGGFALAVVCFYLVPDSAPDGFGSTKNHRVGSKYLCGAIGLAAVAFFSRPIGLLMLWPAASFAIAAAGYSFVGARIFRKDQGRLPLATRLLLWPILLGQHLSLLYYRRQCNAWDRLTDRAWIGRKLNAAEAREAIARGVSAVLDLTGEFSEASPFLALNYLQLPIMDLTAPSPEQLDRAIEFINAAASQGVVYIHCKIGYSRTAAVAGAYLLSNGFAATTGEAVAHLRAVRPSIIIRTEAVNAIRNYKAADVIRGGIAIPPMPSAAF